MTFADFVVLAALVAFYPACFALGWWIGGRISQADLDRRDRDRGL